MSGFGGSWGRAWGGGYGAPFVPAPIAPPLTVDYDPLAQPSAIHGYMTFSQASHASMDGLPSTPARMTFDD